MLKPKTEYKPTAKYCILSREHNSQIISACNINHSERIARCNNHIVQFIFFNTLKLEMSSPEFTTRKSLTYINILQG